MNRTATISPNLAAERDRLLTSIIAIRKAGAVAPANCWLAESQQTKNGKTYHYIKLVMEPPFRKRKISSLGKPSSSKHREWQEALARRNAIAELEQQLKLLEELIDRQASAADEVASASLPSQSYVESID